MEKKVIKHHIKGQKHPGKTNWAKVVSESNRAPADEENPELVGKRTFKKVPKS